MTITQANIFFYLFMDDHLFLLNLGLLHIRSKDLVWIAMNRYQDFEHYSIYFITMFDFLKETFSAI